jgi:hypothetical protein
MKLIVFNKITLDQLSEHSRGHTSFLSLIVTESKFLPQVLEFRQEEAKKR